ncbi:MAG: transglycosylase SLT domain-containing protein [Campylobacterota bacterium]
MRAFGFLLLPLLVFGQISLQELQKMPTSLAKDFYIWQYLKQDITPAQAKQAYEQAKNQNRYKIQKQYLAKSGDEKLQRKKQCRKMELGKLLEAEKECFETGFSVTKLESAPHSAKIKLYNSQKEQTYKNLAHIFLAGNVFTAAVDNPEYFYTLFNDSSKSFRQRYMNRKASKKQVQKLAEKEAFSQSVVYSVLDTKMQNFNASLATAVDSSALSADANFYLGINAIGFDKPKIADTYFQKAGEKYYYRFDKDKALFWRYKSSGKEKYLKKLAKSSDLNVYTVYAKQNYDYTYIEGFEQESSDYDVHDPFAWHQTLQKLQDATKLELIEMASRFKTNQTLGHYAFVMERYHEYDKHYFVTPLKEDLAKMAEDKRQLALLYALTRQESRFIPASVSTSFALGKTQIMPFLIKDIAKQKKEDTQLTDLFYPKKSYEYALYQMDFLQKHLYHPLLVAYGYNGGIGFTKRQVLQAGLFGGGKYDPWMSMELVPYSESRKYGKKVLANYLVYLDILGEKTGLQALLAPLQSGKKIARWQKE